VTLAFRADFFFFVLFLFTFTRASVTPYSILFSFTRKELT
jgi:hypothetical protein